MSLVLAAAAATPAVAADNLQRMLVSSEAQVPWFGGQVVSIAHTSVV